jgi:SAM-dependent methyltransferase
MLPRSIAELVANTNSRLGKWLPFAARGAWWVWGATFDLWHGVETTRAIRSPGQEKSGYRGAVPWFWTRVLPRSSVTKSDVFVDVGSGKGRALLIAANRYPFQRVIGVEFDENLHEVAQRNVRRFRGKLAPIELVNDDVVTWRVPTDVSVVFMNNPFTGSIFERFMSNLRSSLDERPRELRIIYSKPKMHQMVIDAGFVQVAEFGSLRVYK